jgi:cell division protein FtsI (penicillin-binding protein 3)
VADMPAHAWRATFSRRLTVAAVLCLLWVAAILVRLILLQVVHHDDLRDRAVRQQRQTEELQPTRGEIVDRHGRVLAYSVDADSIQAYPRTFDDPEAGAATLCEALGDCSAADRRQLAERLAGRGGASPGFAWVRRKVTPEQARRIAALELEGIRFTPEGRRWYPHRQLAAHVLGFVGTDNVGLAGIEAAYDPLIRGEAGTLLVHRDARGQTFSRVERLPTAGDTLELSLDAAVQHIVERELQRGVEEARALGGSVVVMDPRTGEILALANYPTFNPNFFGEVPPAVRRNRAVQDAYEPGSTFKIVTAGAALEEHVVDPQEPVDVRAGVIRFGARTITDVQRHGILSFEDVIVQSSNVGTIKVGLRLGPDRLIDYIRRFGFGRTASPDFRGESAGRVYRPEALDDSALASVAMGYQVSVTPLQMAAAISAVANGGELLQPRVVRAVVRDGERMPVPRTVVGRPIGEGTARQLVTMMEAVVARGTARRAAVPGYTIAGKTGTAQKLVGGTYSRTDYNVSFAGFVPSRAPSFTIVVLVDTPRGVQAYGGVVAAPIFQRIADAVLQHYGVPPDAPVPPLTVVRRTARDADAGPAVTAAIAHVPADGVTRTPASPAHMPDLRGLSAREASRLLARLGVEPRLVGDGLVGDQQPPAGTPLDAVGTATLWLAQRSFIRHASMAAP